MTHLIKSHYRQTDLYLLLQFLLVSLVHILDHVLHHQHHVLSHLHHHAHRLLLVWHILLRGGFVLPWTPKSWCRLCVCFHSVDIFFVMGVPASASKGAISFLVVLALWHDMVSCHVSHQICLWFWLVPTLITYVDSLTYFIVIEMAVFTGACRHLVAWLVALVFRT